MDDREKLQRYLTEDGLLKQYPSKKPLRMLALARIAEHFEMGRKYTEKEVNEIIRGSQTFSDHELIRRELFTYGFLGRLRDGSSYWREKKGVE
ncbi:hypothetical protein lbkm_3645 [Lachnospiraceae bacterium KM106-2]|nr:hypothetical protein lbkm_3645 [Lachnospiraceae bacterium KM106-2]